MIIDVRDSRLAPGRLAPGLVAFTLVACAPPARAQPSPAARVADRDGSHDFDFELGSWTAHIRRLVHPLSGATTWVELDGSSVVRPVWGGAANLGELDVSGGGAHLEGLSLRVYDPHARQWSIFWANRADGALGRPMIGQFEDGRGEFYDQESFEGRAIYVRFVFSDRSPTTFRLEQAFSADGGKTWEPNWIATFARVAPAAGSSR